MQFGIEPYWLPRAGRSRQFSAVAVVVLARAAAPLCGPDVGSVVLAGAVLCGYAPALSQRLGMPVFDGVACAVELVCTRWALDSAA